MLVYWETSQRPLIIRTVWVEGYRHAILSETECFGSSPRQKHKDKKSNISSTSFGDSRVPLTTEIHGIKPNNDATPVCITRKPAQYQMNSIIPYKSESIEQNPLSERVLQWLDLAGQETLKLEVCKTKLSQIRHSLPEVKVSSNDMFNFSALNKNKIRLMKTDLELGNYQLSFQKNTLYDKDNITNKIMQKNQNNKKSTDRKAYLQNIKSNEQNYKNSTYFESNTQQTNITDDEDETDDHRDNSTGENIQLENQPESGDSLRKNLYDSDSESLFFNDEKETHHKIRSPINSAFENDYIHIIKKQILETSCNTYVTRKKLHIFIPSLPKKFNSSISNENEPHTSKT